MSVSQEAEMDDGTGVSQIARDFAVWLDRVTRRPDGPDDGGPRHRAEVAAD